MQTIMLIITLLLWQPSTSVSVSLPACPNNTVTVRHNRRPACDLTSGGILIELGTTRVECLDQGGRFLVINDRRVCVGEDF